MFFPFMRPVPPPSKRTPLMPVIPGLQLNLNVDHTQLLGTMIMMGLSRRPGFKEEMESFMSFLQRMQEAADAISIQMETVHQEFQKVKAKVAERSETPVQREVPRQEGPMLVNPLLQHLFRLMSY